MALGDRSIFSLIMGGALKCLDGDAEFGRDSSALK
jgi:hypothetical protein